MRKRLASLPTTTISMTTRLVMIALAVIIGASAPVMASAQSLRGTSFTTETGNHTVEWNENWGASLTAEDDFSTMIMIEGQIMIYAVMIIHDPELGLSERAVYHSLSGVLMSSFDSPPSHSIEWEEGDGSYRGAHILPLSGIDFVIFLRVDPGAPGMGPTMQFAAAPLRAFPVSLEAMQSELTLDGVPVLDGEDGKDVMARLEADTVADADAGAPARSSDADSASEPLPGREARETDQRSRLHRDPQMPSARKNDMRFVSEANGYTVTFTEMWTNMASTNSTIGEFSISSDSGRTVVSFTGRSTTETNRQAFFEDIDARESRYSGYVGSVISDDRLLIVTWTADNELAILEYVFTDDDTVVTIMVTITSANPDRYIEETAGIEIDGEPILRDWDEISLDDD